MECTLYPVQTLQAGHDPGVQQATFHMILDLHVSDLAYRLRHLAADQKLLLRFMFSSDCHRVEII